jgi:membrane glycosyltransferase
MATSQPEPIDSVVLPTPRRRRPLWLLVPLAAIEALIISSVMIFLGVILAMMIISFRGCATVGSGQGLALGVIVFVLLNTPLSIILAGLTTFFVKKTVISDLIPISGVVWGGLLGTVWMVMFLLATGC